VYAGLLLILIGLWLFVRTWWGHLPHLVAAKAFG
jgi:hypothetical protein